MKEAAGEANMTIVTIVLIAIVLGAGTLIVTNIMNGSGKTRDSKCRQLGGVLDSTVTGTNKNCMCSDGTYRTVADSSKTGVSCGLDANGNTYTVTY